MAFEQESAVLKKTFDVNSPVNKYDLLTLEQQSKGLTEEHILLAFQALDDLIPHLGVYTKIFQKLRADLYAAVYSAELTGTVEKTNEFIQKVPYFSLINQVFEQRHEVTEKLTEQLETVKRSLFEKHKHLEEAQENIGEKESRINSLSSAKDDLETAIKSKEKRLEELQEELEETRELAKMKEYQLECDISDLNDALFDAKQEINYLIQFKKSYDDIYYAFMDKTGTLGEAPKKKNSVIATKRANLLSSIASARKLEDQMLFVMNTAIEEYDNYIDSHKSTVMEKSVHTGMSEGDQDLQELAIDEADQELERVKIRFRATVENLMNELGLLKNHNDMLLEQIHILEDSKPTLKIKDKYNRSGKGDSILSAGLEEEELSEAQADPFIPQERVFSKYAAMLYTSNNHGKTFEEFKEASFCASCGEKTVICPHKLSGPEKIFLLPHNCSHIKISRPKVRITKEPTNRKIKIFLRANFLCKNLSRTMFFGLEHLNSNLDFGLYNSRSQTMPSTPGTEVSRESSLLGAGDVYMVHTAERLWEDYNHRTKVQRKIPRTLTLERTQSVMEEFLGYLIWTDEFLSDDEANSSIMDVLYSFMKERYLMKDVVYMAAHDFLSAITQHAGSNKLIQLLGHVLVGNLDAACLRYILLICDIISSVDWKEVEDFRAFATAVYPFLNDDDFENLQMSYTSYSENKISSQHVASFIINIILKYREPRFHELENQLVPYQNNENGHLTEMEFKEAIDNIIPLCNERTRHRLYMQAEKAVQWDRISNSVPIMRLAQITGYLALQQIAAVVKENVSLRVREWRQHAAYTESVSANQYTESNKELLTMGHVKQMAASLNRQLRHSKENRSSFPNEENQDS
ncbi:unnamed protein product [Lymnaea stagnalis]|uniref:Uncharacterized protein n=1 Tax=Lymnaea stagnalis TaxID=6523 RepID=A0AAV2H8X9_LYMST